MNGTKRYLIKGREAVGFLGLLILLLPLLAGCGAEPTAVGEAAPTEVAAQPTTAPTEAPTEPPPSATPTEPPPTNTPESEATPTNTPTPEPIDDSGCITCHTSEETLQALATEEEKPEVESEGEG